MKAIELHSDQELPLGLLLVTAVAGAVTIAGDRPVVDAAVVGGLGIVAPLALGGWARWTVAAVAAAIGTGIDPGPAAATFALPAGVAAAWSILERARRAGAQDLASMIGLARSFDAVISLLVPTWAAVAAGSLLASFAGVELFGITEPIVRLTGVHYLYAGVGTLAIARRLRAEHSDGVLLALVAVAATALAPPIVAVGFVMGHPLPQVGGAAVMTVGVWSAAELLLISLRRPGDGPRRLLRLLAGLAPWVPMVLAVAWAAAQHIAGIPALSIPDMARLHGLTNGIGFVLLGLLATAPVPEDAPAPTAVEARP